jgi:hypothetical protein
MFREFGSINLVIYWYIGTEPVKMKSPKTISRNTDTIFFIEHIGKLGYYTTTNFVQSPITGFPGGFSHPVHWKA